MTSTAGRSSSRDKLLDAAVSLVAQYGVHNLTIEATAAAAGVTKAGLIYHFKTRSDLLAALVERMAGELELQSRGADHGAAPKPLREQIGHMIDFTFDMPASQQRLLANMLAAVSEEPQLLPPAQALFARAYEELGSGSDSGLGFVLCAALDGVLLLDLLRLYAFTPPQRVALRETLLKLAKDLP